MTKISIITINRNNKDGLRKTMQSVLDQDFDDFEYIVVDGASDDGSLDVIQEFESQFVQKEKVPFQYESKPDKGIFHAMNKGIVKAKGEYLLFLNSGDYLVTPTVLKSFVQFGTTEDFVSGDILVCIDGKKQIRESPDKVDFYLLFNQSIHHQASFIKKSVFDRFGMYNEDNQLMSDWEHSLRSIVVNGVPYRHIGLTVAYYDTNGLSSNNSLHDIAQKEKRNVYLSLMPEFVLSALEQYKVQARLYTEAVALNKEYLNMKNGRFGFVIKSVLWIKKHKRRA